MTKNIPLRRMQAVNDLPKVNSRYAAELLHRRMQVVMVFEN